MTLEEEEEKALGAREEGLGGTEEEREREEGREEREGERGKEGELVAEVVG